MKGKLKKFVVGSLICLGTWGLFNTLKPDYIKVEEWRRTGWDKEYGWTRNDSEFIIDYIQDGYDKRLDNVSYWLEFRVEAFDGEGIKNIEYYVGEYKYASYSISDDKGLFRKSYELGIFVDKFNEKNRNLKKGNHTLVMVMHDYLGNSIKVEKEFEIK